jgi:hypothetical protein
VPTDADELCRECAGAGTDAAGTIHHDGDDALTGTDVVCAGLLSDRAGSGSG